MYPPILFTLTILVNSASSTTTSRCRAIPSSPDWPPLSLWSSLNTTLSGRLIKPIPPAAVCYHDRPEFNAEKCREVFKSWETQGWHVDDPISVMVNQWTGWSCMPIDLDAEDKPTEHTSQGVRANPTEAQIPLPDSEENYVKLELRSEHKRTCSNKGYPAYVVNATETSHIQTAITFARTHNIRLTIKNTGHDLPGRSIAPGSLSIWTHHLNSAEYHPGSFTLSGSGKKVEGDFIVAGSGCQNGKIQDLAHKHGRVFTGGGSRNVGIGGFVTGGGHSMLSPHYGLAADNVVQMEVVIPNGDVLTVNEDQHTDLFWALRGGGGSTFGVITSMVLKVHPDKPLERVSLFGVTQPDSEIAHELVPWGLSKTPFLMDNGISGYMFASHKIQSPIAVPGAEDPHPIVGGFMVIGMLLDPQEEKAAEKAVQPMLEEAKKRWGDKAKVFVDVQRYETFLDWYHVHHDQGPVGASTYIVSRLFDRTTLEDEAKLQRIIEPAVAPSWGLGAYMVAGKGVKNANVSGGSNAVHPAWRDAMVLAMTWTVFPSYDRAAGQEVVKELDEGWQPVRDEMPGSGSYLNEGLTEEKNWQESFWGTNYERLLSIKREMDPTDVFWCKPCVGYDRWTEVETEQGRQLCRVE